MTDAFPGALVGPSSKERKYDRQLRLWAASGQQALEEAHVLLVNSDGVIGAKARHQHQMQVSGVVGVETLKNLVLPGVGGFTIVDPATVTEADLGVNFFLEESSLGKPRAAETCRLLRELNPDVDGRYVVEPIATVLDRDPEFLARHKLVIVSGPMKRSTLDAVCGAAKTRGIPVLYTHSVGFYSSFSLQLPANFPVVETHPDPESTHDLRLLNPWPELLQAGARVRNLDELDDHQHGHVPYVLILLHYLEKWKESHSGQVPSNYKEKSEFREMVRAGARTSNPEGGEENFDEAVAAVLKTLNPFSLRSSIREIFEMEEILNLRSQSDNFWVIAAAVKAFYMKHGVLPLPGSLPDMKAQSADYVSLQNIYKAKAAQDLQEVMQTVRGLEQEFSPRLTPTSEREVEVFCKNAAHIKVIHGRDIPRFPGDELSRKRIHTELANSESVMPIFVAFQILDEVVNELQTMRSADADAAGAAIDDDATWSRAEKRVLETLTTQGDSSAVDEETRRRISAAVKELRRTDGGELHNVSSLTGGLVAQEALKVITRQYVPLDNTCIFDGVASRSEMYRL